MLFGDHAEAFGQHDGNFGHTLFAYEENVRVPLVMGIPGVVTAPVRARQIASVLDIGPTVLDLVGIAGDGTHQGLGNMRDRAVAMGGRLAVASGDPVGTRIIVRIPVTESQP